MHETRPLLILIKIGFYDALGVYKAAMKMIDGVYRRTNWQGYTLTMLGEYWRDQIDLFRGSAGTWT